MAEWLYEAGIGEARAALVADGRIVEARIEREGEGPRIGAILEARLAEPGKLVLDAPGDFLVALGDGADDALAFALVDDVHDRCRVGRSARR